MYTATALTHVGHVVLRIVRPFHWPQTSPCLQALLLLLHAPNTIAEQQRPLRPMHWTGPCRRAPAAASTCSRLSQRYCFSRPPSRACMSNACCGSSTADSINQGSKQQGAVTAAQRHPSHRPPTAGAPTCDYLPTNTCSSRFSCKRCRW